MRYEILDEKGAILNTIIADEAFVEAQFPGHYREVPPTDAEINATRRDAIFTALADIDTRTTKPRTLRELALGNGKTIAWVAAQDAKAEMLREELATL